MLAAQPLPAASSAPARALASPVSLGRELDPPAAEPPVSGERYAIDLSFGTSVPLSVGVDARLETPFGLTAHLGAGHAPSAYLGMVASMLQGADVYPDSASAAVFQAIGGGAWNVRLGVGAMLFDGLEIDAGYTFFTAASALDPSAIEAAIGQRPPFPGSMQVPLSITVHALHVRAGWRLVVLDRLVVRLGLGWTHALGSEVHMSVPSSFRPHALRAETAIHRAIQSYGFTPEILLSAGYRF